MWFSFVVTSPELRTTFEARLRFDADQGEWEAILLPRDQSPQAVMGTCATTACEWFEMLFAAIGFPDLVPAMS